MKVPGILKNKYVCYALMALAALNVIGYLTVKAWECLALFVLAGYSAYCYCKDKSCAILAALFVANFVFGCGRVKEGFADAFKGPMEHLQNARLSLFRAREGFEATDETCGEGSQAAQCKAAGLICGDADAAVQAAQQTGAGAEEKKDDPAQPQQPQQPQPPVDAKPVDSPDQNQNNTPPTDGSTGFGNIF